MPEGWQTDGSLLHLVSASITTAFTTTTLPIATASITTATLATTSLFAYHLPSQRRLGAQWRQERWLGRMRHRRDAYPRPDWRRANRGAVLHNGWRVQAQGLGQRRPRLLLLLLQVPRIPVRQLVLHLRAVDRRGRLVWHRPAAESLHPLIRVHDIPGGRAAMLAARPSAVRSKLQGSDPVCSQLQMTCASATW